MGRKSPAPTASLSAKLLTSSLHSGFSQETFLSWNQNTMWNGQSGAWPCLGARWVVPCCSLKRIHKQKAFGCNKAQLLLNKAKFHSVGTLLQLQRYNGNIIIIKRYSASYQKKFPPALPISQQWLMTTFFDAYLPLLHRTDALQTPPALPALPFLSPLIHRDADLQKSAW